MLQKIEDILEREKGVVDEIEEARRRSLLEQEDLRRRVENRIREEEEIIEEEVIKGYREEVLRLQSEKENAIKNIQKSAEDLLSENTLHETMVTRMMKLLLDSS